MRKLTSTLLVLAALASSLQLQAQDFPELDKSPMDVAYFPDRLPYTDLRGRKTTAPAVKIYYSRPQANGRTMLGDKIKYGQMWRMGANEANEITFYSDVEMGGTTVEAGTYSLFAIPEADKWTFVLHSKLNTWGNYALKDSKEIARAEGTVSKSDKYVEALAMMFKQTDAGVTLMVGWENTVAELTFTMD